MVADVRLLGVPEFIAALTKMSARAEAAGEVFVRKGGHVIEAKAKARMNGRPGPNVITGTLRRSVTVSDPKHLGPGAWETRTGPASVYGRRIELGFHGADSRGRVYKQPGYPYMRPGLDDATGDLIRLQEEVWVGMLKV